jgi:uncharacterized protein (TIRG00374 family)
MKKIKWKLIYNIVIIVFIAGVIYYFCFSKNGLTDLYKNYEQFSFGWLFVATVAQLINLIIEVFIVHTFAISAGEKKYTLKKSIRVAFVGQFFNSVTPSASGGQPMQVYVMNKQGVGTGRATSALTQKFLVYQSTLVMYSIFAMLFSFRYFFHLDKGILFWSLIGFAVQAFAILIILFFSFNRKATMHIISGFFKLLGKMHFIKNPEEKIKGLKVQLLAFHEGNHNLYKNKKLLIISYILTLLQMTIAFMIPYFVYKSFHLSGKRAIDMLCAQTFTIMSTSFFPIPGASGANEGMNMVFLNRFFTQETIKPAVIIIRLISYYLTILVSAPFAYSIKSTKKTK